MNKKEIEIFKMNPDGIVIGCKKNKFKICDNIQLIPMTSNK